MIYEKESAVNKRKLLLTLAFFGLPVVVVVEIVYIYIGFPGNFWEMKFVDVANIFAQAATAAAFFLGFHQYQRNRGIERQTILAAECKAILGKMVTVIDGFKGGGETRFDNIKSCVSKLSNLGVDFNVVFTALDESA